MATVTEDDVNTIKVLDKSEEELETFSVQNDLSLSGSDLVEVQSYFRDCDRNPTRLEIEILAQTWSEHCKHRIFHARLQHEKEGSEEIIDGIFQTFIESVTEEVQYKKPDFVLSAFDDNAGFVALDDSQAVCMKLETHNHPSAIEPYAGANTGLGGVIRDILGAGLGARPIGSLDVFCLGSPDQDRENLPEGVIHPLGIFRGVVHGVRDYGNRMGIPTVAGALQFAPDYTYNPLVFCGTVGVIPSDDIEKEITPELDLVTAGGLTGRDGLHGATFSSDTLSHESHEEDQGSVQIGNPIEEKKVADFILAARERGLIQFITDCGAGGYSSAVGEMVEETGGRVQLEDVPLKEEGLDPWEIFLSESQERMVLAVDPADLNELQELADDYETNCHKIGKVTDTGRLRVFYEDQLLCDLECDFMHSPPRLDIESRYSSPNMTSKQICDHPPVSESLNKLLTNINITSREPVIREYDHEVQGNTVLKPLAGPTGDAPEDGVVLRIKDSSKAVAVGLSLLPEYGRLNPQKMGRATVDETVRQLVSAGANPERIALLDNFSMGNPELSEKLGELVEAAKGMAAVARDYECPFISGKDSFYNSYDTEAGETISVPMTLVISGFGILSDINDRIGSSLNEPDNELFLLGKTRPELGGSCYTRILDRKVGNVPEVNTTRFEERYQNLHRAIRSKLITSMHDLSEGGLGVSLAEMSFSQQAGVKIDLEEVPTEESLHPAEILFSESAGRLLVEVEPSDCNEFQSLFRDDQVRKIGETTGQDDQFIVNQDNQELINESIRELKDQWKNGLTPYY